MSHNIYLIIKKGSRMRRRRRRRKVEQQIMNKPTQLLLSKAKHSSTKHNILRKGKIYPIIAGKTFSYHHQK